MGATLHVELVGANSYTARTLDAPAEPPADTRHAAASGGRGVCFDFQRAAAAAATRAGTYNLIYKDNCCEFLK